MEKGSWGKKSSNMVEAEFYAKLSEALYFGNQYLGFEVKKQSAAFKNRSGKQQ